MILCRVYTLQRVLPHHLQIQSGRSPCSTTNINSVWQLNPNYKTHETSHALCMQKEECTYCDSRKDLLTHLHIRTWNVNIFEPWFHHALTQRWSRGSSRLSKREYDNKMALSSRQNSTMWAEQCSLSQKSQNANKLVNRQYLSDIYGNNS